VASIPDRSISMRLARILVAALTLSLSLSLAACGSSSITGPSSPSHEMEGQGAMGSGS